MKNLELKELLASKHFMLNEKEKHTYKMSDKIELIDDDGYKYLISYSSFRSTLSSGAFSAYNPFTVENIRHYIIINDINVGLLSNEYISIFNKLKFKCGCGKIFYRTLDSFKNGNQTRCLTCSNSKSSYEIKTEKILQKIGIDYVPQHPIKIKDSLHIFDYYFPNMLKMIEVDGEQHFRPISKFGGKDAFEDRIKRDLEKNKYCNENQIDLLRIPYYEFNSNNYSNLIKKFLEYD